MTDLTRGAGGAPAQAAVDHQAGVVLDDDGDVESGAEGPEDVGVRPAGVPQMKCPEGTLSARS